MKRTQKKPRRFKTIVALAFGLFLVIFCSGPLHAVTIGSFSWSGSIVGEDPDYTTSGNAVFAVEGSTLTIIVTNNTLDSTVTIGEALSGLTWDIIGPGVILEPYKAEIYTGSRLVGFGATTDTDISSEWFFKDDVSAVSATGESIGPFAIGTVGDIYFGADTFDTEDAFLFVDDGTGHNLYNLFGPSGPNGIEVAIVNQNVDFSSGGFENHGPVVQGWNGSSTGPGQMIFTFDFDGDLGEGDIVNVRPLFGTDGAPLPEPYTATMLLLAGGYIGLLGFNRRRNRP